MNCFTHSIQCSLAPAALCLAMMLGAAETHAALLVYEGFQYGDASSTRAGADLLHGQPDGSGGDTDATGLSGTWQDSAGPGQSSDLFMAAGSLSLGQVVTSGNHVRGDTNLNNDLFSRTVTADLDSGSELWFSFLADKLQNNFSAAEGGVVIGNQAVNDSQVGEDNASTGLIGFGIAPTTSGNDWTAYGWDGTSEVVGGSSLSVSVGGGDVHLLVGKISFNTGTGGADEFSLFDYNAGTEMLDLVTSLEVDADETALDTLSLTRQVNTAYDEIRIGTTQRDVVAVPNPAALPAGLALIGLLALRRRMG